MNSKAFASRSSGTRTARSASAGIETLAEVCAKTGWQVHAYVCVVAERSFVAQLRLLAVGLADFWQTTLVR